MPIDASQLTLQESLRLIVSRHTGIVRRFRIHSVEPSDPAFWYCAAEVASKHTSAGAVGLDLNSTIIACLAEAAERYCAQIFDERRITYETAQQLRQDGKKTIEIPDTVFLSCQPKDLKSKLIPFHSSRYFSWVEGKSLLTKESIWVPASLVYLGYPRKNEHFWESTSVGLAAGATVDDAKLRALCELIEREAAIIAWLTKQHVGLVNLQSYKSDMVHRAAQCHLAAGAELKIFDITTDLGIPVFLAIAKRTLGRPALAVGTACHPNSNIAVTKAVLEAGQIHYLAKGLVRQFPSYSPSENFDEITNFESRALLYSHPQMLPAVDFLWNSQLVAPERVLPLNIQSSISLALNKFRELSIDVVWVDLTTPDIEDLGLKVVRVIAPKLQPLEANFHFRHLIVERFTQWLPSGFSNETQTWLNPFPHPIA
jgi:ribosomal protein S12 methylthiotransferase accessory factor